MKTSSYRLIFTICILLAGIIILMIPGCIQQVAKKRLTYEQVYERGEPQLTGSLPGIQGWLDDEHYLELITVDEDEKVSNLMKVNVATGDTSLYINYQALNEKLPEGIRIQRNIARTEDYNYFLFRKDDNLYFFSREKESFKQLTASPSEEKNPRFSPDGKFVAFTRDFNLFVVNVETGLEKKLTSDGSDLIYNGWASWVYYEEILGRGSRYAAFWWSPNSEMLAFLRFDDKPVPEFPIYRADGVHGELEIQRYPKAGDPNPLVKLGIIHIKTGKIVWVDTNENIDRYVAWPFWTRDSKELFFQYMNRDQDNIIIYAADPFTGQKTEIYNEKQDSWVEFFEDLYFFEDGSGFLLRSDVDGWLHIYYYDLKGNLIKRLTSGEWRVTNIALADEENKVVYFHSTMGKSTENHLCRVNLNGEDLFQLTKDEGTHRATVSSNGSYFYDRFSNIHQPAKIELYDNNGELIRVLGDRKTTLMDEYDPGKVELFTIPSGDGYDLPAVWVLPPDFNKNKKYPVIFRVYGGPNSGTVRNSYRGMSDHFMAQNGIITISVDHRGSGHFGKKSVALMHRNLGKWEMNDLIAAVKWLREQPFIDSTKIGITGGSYGGYTTCMALTYGAGYFTHGIAGSSVTSWKLYDNVYTERYMDTPEQNPEGYEFGSAMTHAENYKGYLLLTHGTMDDNVHMQNTIQLVDKLTDMNKDFELMLYPNQRHGIGFPKRNHTTRESVQFWFRHFLGKELEK